MCVGVRVCVLGCVCSVVYVLVCVLVHVCWCVCVLLCKCMLLGMLGYACTGVGVMCVCAGAPMLMCTT